MTGRTLLHYNIVEKLGEGGMGVAWKARDTHLDRFVALKVLPPEKVVDAERMRRFVQEAKAASALNHPNIIHIYDIAEADSVPFIAMEYVAAAVVGPRKRTQVCHVTIPPLERVEDEWDGTVEAPADEAAASRDSGNGSRRATDD